MGALAFVLRPVVRRLMRRVYDQRVTQFAELPVVDGGVVFLGDSITEGGCWSEFLPELPVRNRGISGDTTQGVLDRLDQVTRCRPNKLFVLIGTNDLGNGIPQRNITKNVATLIDTVRRDSPGTRVYLQAVFPRAKRYSARLQRLNAAYRELAADRGVTFIDLWSVLADERQEIRGEFSNDKLHLTGPGYRVWVDALRPYVLDASDEPKAPDLFISS